MLKIYPAIFHKEDNAYWVEFPDLEGCNSCGDSLEETMENAQEALGLYLVALMESDQELPAASDIVDVISDDIVSYVSADVDKYRRSTRAVKKTLSLPEWLAVEAERRNISLSKVLQEGLKSQLGL